MIEEAQETLNKGLKLKSKKITIQNQIYKKTNFCIIRILHWKV